MFKNPPFCKLALPVVIASILSACGSGSSNENPSIEGKIDDLDRFSLCHDSNLDGQCGTTENTKSFKTLALALAGLATEGRGPVIVTGNESLLFAPSAASNASAWSTLVYNESLVNPTTGTNEAAIATYLHEKLGLAVNGELSSAEQSALMASIAAALKRHSAANPYAVIGAVIDAAVKQSSLINAVPTSAQITSQAVLTRNFDTQIEATQKVSWQTSDGDERVEQIVVAGEKIMVVNRWHNRLAIVSANAQTPVVDTQPFAAIYTAGHHEYSTEADWVSGASEHAISQSWLADDGDTLYALVDGPREVDVPEDDSYGLFRVPLTDGKVPTFMVGSVDGATEFNVPHRDPSVTRINSKSLKNAIQLNSGDVLAYDSEAGYVRFYDANLSEDLTKAFPLDRNLFDWTLADDGQTLLTLQGPLNGAQTPLLQAYNTSDLSVKAHLSLSADADTLLGSKTGNRVIVLEGNTAHVITTADLSVVSSVALVGAPSNLSQLSADGSRAALVFNDEIHVLNLAEAFPIMEGSMAYDSRLRALAFNGNDEILYSDGSGELSSMSLVGLTSSPQNVDNLLVQALNSINENSLNHGYDLDAVIHPLNMSAQYGVIDLSWTSTHGHVVTDGSVNQGNVTQPAMGSANVIDTISVSSEYSFRQAKQTSDVKALDIAIRPHSETREQTVTTLAGGLAGRQIALMAANGDGSQLATWFYDTDAGQPSGLVLFSVNGEKGVTAQNTVPIVLPTNYAGSTVRGLAYGGDNIYVVIAEGMSASTVEADGLGRILTYSDGEWSGDLQLDGIVRNKGVSVSGDGNALSIAQDTTPEGAEAGTTIVTVYNTQSLALISTIYTDQDATGRRYPALAVSNDGQAVMGYTRNQSRQLHYYQADTASDAASKAQASYDISTTTFGVAYDDTIDAFIAGDGNAEVRVFATASNGDWSTPTVFETSRGAWNGVSEIRGAGRMYDAVMANGTAYLWSRYQGVTAIDLTDPANPQERFWAPLEHQERYAFAISGNDSLLFSHAYNKSAGYSAIGVVLAQ
jgi:hypothetical protein